MMGELGSNISWFSMIKEDHTIRKEATISFITFIKGGNDALSSLRRETMFINILSRSSSSRS